MAFGKAPGAKKDESRARQKTRRKKAKQLHVKQANHYTSTSTVLTKGNVLCAPFSLLLSRTRCVWALL